MNQIYGGGLALVFLIGIGLFNIILGILWIRKRNRSKVWGAVRLILGVLLIIVPPALYFTLRKLGQI